MLFLFSEKQDLLGIEENVKQLFVNTVFTKLQTEIRLTPMA
ncbi:hypothetical protein BMS3Abin05_02673 [bacterium BMS3Abin05]|nr:hypothetical protein BMS3Abin05_02673 [bacterium BMS3Abin05]